MSHHAVRLRLACRYALFAGLATALNLATQILYLAILPGGQLAIALSIAAGTATGLVGKFLLDRRWIFASEPSSASATLQTFSLYTFTGLATTLLFWAVEYAFHLCFGTDRMRYLGAVIGLAAGYALKYRLDARFVFTGQACPPRHRLPAGPAAPDMPRND